MSTTTLKDSPWAKADQERHSEFMEAQAAVMETKLELWKHRIDHPELLGKQWPEHARLFWVEAMEYADKDGKNSPTGKTLTFNVIAVNSHDAHNKVIENLAYHGLGKNWLTRSNSSLLVLS
jgi:hypothetical protein